MAYDALSLSVLCRELSEKLTGGKITKIYQPERDEIILFVFNRQTYKVVISANAGVNRIHLTQMPTDNPKTAPAFCMLLRKHLTNAAIEQITQMPYERVLDFTLSGSDELGYRQSLHLIFELTGKTSNIILTDGEYIVYDSIKHLPQDIGTSRIIMTGAKYKFFLPQNKIPPFDAARVKLFLQNNAQPLSKALAENLLGVSQATVNEVLFGIDENDKTKKNLQRVLQRLESYRANLQNPRPNVVLNRGMPTDVCPFDYLSKRGEKKFFETLNEAHDYYYFTADKIQRFNDKAKSVNTVIKNAVSRTQKKLAIQRQTVLEAEKRETYRQYGDLILANLWQKPVGNKLICDDYYNGGRAEIPLDETLSLQQNAQAYYKKYRKLKSAAEHNARLVEENEKLLQYLLTVKQNMAYCSEAEDVQQIRSELEGAGLIKQSRTKVKEPPVKPLRYNVHGFDVYVGKNNVQNNFVTFRLASSNDLWLHTQKIHSSHVVISAEGDVPDKVILGAAEICAYFSQAAEGSKIPVDYTLRKNVKKPPHAPLGFVVYTDFKTVIVNPDRHTEWLV